MFTSWSKISNSWMDWIFTILLLRLRKTILGEHNTKTRLESEAFRTRTRPFRYQPHYSYEYNRKRGILFYDFALLELEERVDWSKYPHIRPICLPDQGMRDFKGELATIVGWGNDHIYYESLQNSLIKGVPTNRVTTSLHKLDVR